MMADFICACCGESRCIHTQAVIMFCLPEDAEFWVSGMPCVFSGFCIVCLGDDDGNR